MVSFTTRMVRGKVRVTYKLRMLMVHKSDYFFRPYAPPANMQAFLQRLRRMNMPSAITRDLLKSIGISENIVPRLFATLRFLDFITDSDQPTETLVGLAGSTGDEYRQLLEKTIRKAYADDFQNIDPSRDTQERVMNAFQRYMPRSQHSRQVMLFLGLCREAGIPTVDVPRRRGMRNRAQHQSYTGRGARQRSLQNNNGATGRTAHIQQDVRHDSQFLGITLEDAAYMPEEDFWEVWNAVGTLFLRRAQRVHISALNDHDTDIGNMQEQGLDKPK